PAPTRRARSRSIRSRGASRMFSNARGLGTRAPAEEPAAHAATGREADGRREQNAEEDHRADAEIERCAEQARPADIAAPQVAKTGIRQEPFHGPLVRAGSR